MIAIGNNELGDKLGRFATCPHCGLPHEVVSNRSQKLVNDEWQAGGLTLECVKCSDGKSYLVGLNGQEVIR